MPAPVTLSPIFTGTPDETDGIELPTISLQEDADVKVPGGLALSDRIADGPSPDRSALSAVDTATDMSPTDFGSTGLVAINNRGAISVWCEFVDAAQYAVVRLIFYDNSGTAVPLFVSEPMTLVATTFRKTSSGDFLSEPKLVESFGASKCRPYLVTKGTGNVDIFVRPL